VLHCHFAFHTSHFLSADRVAEPHDPGAPDVVDHSIHGMKGMLIPIRVAPRDGGARRPAHDDAARRIRIIAQGRPGVYRDSVEGMAFIPVEGAEPAADSIPIPSPALVLRRGEPVAITVVNRMRAPTAVHWHGLELPSYSDGVPGWSGSGDRIAPLIAPGDSFTAEFTPPRAGTFIYHAHSNELHQIGGGLYGALLVVEDDHDPARERVVIAGGDGFFSPGARVNGSLTPAPIRIPADTPIRFRLIDIALDYRVGMQLLQGETPQAWRMIAKDGADIPTERQHATTEPWISGPGETADFEVSLPRGTYTLMVRHVFGDWEVPVEVRSGW
jgi:FtsP/CotA-like multicopper oxidase with cupredoxin domain